MHHSPSPEDPGAGPAPAQRRDRPRAAPGRPLPLLLLALAAALPGALAAQTAAPPVDSIPPAEFGTPALESALAAEPFATAEPRRGAGPLAYGLLLGGVALAAVAAGMVLRLRRDREPPLSEPFLVFAPPATPPPAQPLRIEAPPRLVPAARAPQQRVRVGPAALPVAAGARTPAPEPVSDDELTVRLEIPAEGRIQFLPGALEVMEGADPQREIRFLRTGGPVEEYTIGRTGGDPRRHVQLAAPTVSRLHARMRFGAGAWSIVNLSGTNPLRVNGRELRMEEESRVADGDRIEVGEVVLRFRGAPQ